VKRGLPLDEKWSRIGGILGNFMQTNGRFMKSRIFKWPNFGRMGAYLQ
jgi:hypothetical protein